MNKPFVGVLVTALIFSWPGSGVTIRADDGLEPMITDAAMTGWVRTNTPDRTWRFVDGVLHCTGKPIGEIRTAKMYQNFVMELEWRHMVPRGNAGIFVWADDITSRGVPFHRGIEVQVLENEYGNNESHTTHGDIFPIHGATMTPINGRGGSRAFPTEMLSKPSPQWNHYRIECIDGAIALSVNGTLVTRGRDCVPRVGYICLESEGGVVEYRNVRIKELPGSEVPADQIAIADRGYRSLYTGLDLAGWEAGDSSNWKSDDWILTFDPQGLSSGSIRTTDEYPGAGFVVDVRLKEPTSSLVIEIGNGFQIDFAATAIAAHLQKPGQWNRVEVIAGSQGRTLLINGNEIAASEHVSKPQSEHGHALTLKPTGKVEFANLYVSP